MSSYILGTKLNIEQEIRIHNFFGSNCVSGGSPTGTRTSADDHGPRRQTRSCLVQSRSTKRVYRPAAEDKRCNG
jgi:hypothetical protein